MKKHKLYTSISLLMMICFTVAISIFTDWFWAPFLAAGGYILRTMAEGLDERASNKLGANVVETHLWTDYAPVEESEKDSCLAKKLKQNDRQLKKKTNSSEIPDSSKKKGKSK